MFILTIISLCISIVSLIVVFLIFIKHCKLKSSTKVMQVTTDIDIGKCSIIGNNKDSFEIKIYSNGKNYNYFVKDGELSAIKTDNMKKEFKY